MLESIKSFLIRKLCGTTATDEEVTKLYIVCRELGLSEQDILNLDTKKIETIYAGIK